MLHITYAACGCYATDDSCPHEEFYTGYNLHITESFAFLYDFAAEPKAISYLLSDIEYYIRT